MGTVHQFSVPRNQPAAAPAQALAQALRLAIDAQVGAEAPFAAREVAAALRGREEIAELQVLTAERVRQRFTISFPEMAEMAEELSYEKERAEAADRAKSECLAAASHELRTPLNAIIGFSSVIRTDMADTIKSDQTHEFLGHIHEAGEHLLELSDISA